MFTKSLSTILKTFEKTASDLNKFIDANVTTITNNAEKVAQIQATNSAMLFDNKRASKVLTNINKIIEE